MLCIGGLKSVGGALSSSAVVAALVGQDIVLNSIELTAAGGAAALVLDNRSTMGWLNSSSHFGLDGSANIQMSSSNANAGLYLASTTAGAIALAITNAGARLAMSGAGTTDYLIGDGTNVLFAGGIGVGNAATATVAVGSLAKKIQIFDAAGSSLGFVPVYASIT